MDRRVFSNSSTTTAPCLISPLKMEKQLGRKTSKKTSWFAPTCSVWALIMTVIDSFTLNKEDLFLLLLLLTFTSQQVRIQKCGISDLEMITSCFVKYSDVFLEQEGGNWWSSYVVCFVLISMFLLCWRWSLKRFSALYMCWEREGDNLEGSCTCLDDNKASVETSGGLSSRMSKP